MADSDGAPVTLNAVRGGVELRSSTESMGTTTPPGRLQPHLFAALAELERE